MSSECGGTPATRHTPAGCIDKQGKGVGPGLRGRDSKHKMELRVACTVEPLNTECREVGLSEEVKIMGE